MTAFAETLKPASEPAPVPVVQEPVSAASEVSPTSEPVKQAEPETGVPESAKKPQEGQLAAMIAERKKRQQAELELAHLRGRLEGIEKKEDPKAKGPTKEDLENEYLLDPRGVTQRLIEEHIQNAIFQDRMARSVVSVRREFKDYDEFLEKYKDYTPDPVFMQQIRQHPEPARFVYETLKSQERFEAVNKDPAEYEKKLRAEIEAKVRKELALKEAAQTPTMPTTTSAGGATSAGPASTVEDLFAARRNRKR